MPKDVTVEELMNWLAKDRDGYVYLGQDGQWHITNPSEDTRHRVIQDYMVNKLVQNGVLTSKYPGTKAADQAYRLR